MLSAHFLKGELQRIYYFDKPHNDAYPTVQLPRDDRQMKGFRWDPDKRPTGGADITPYIPRQSERLTYEARPQAKFPQTEIYFPGYMKEVYAGLAARDSAQRESRRMRDSLRLDKPRIDPPDSTLLASARSDSTNVEPPALPEETEGNIVPGESRPDESEPEQPDAQSPEGPEPEQPALDPHVADSIAHLRAVRDSIRAVQKAQRAARDSIQAVQDSLAALKQAQRDSVRNARNAKREARWAALDARDAARDSVKAARKQAKYRKQVIRKLEIRDREAAREQERLEKYILYYEKVKARREAREARRPKREPRVKEDKVKKSKKNLEVQK